jgi:hypothetical protein
MVARRHPRDERGVVLPSPVVILSILAVAMAAVAFVVTHDTGPDRREITTIPTGADHSPEPGPTTRPEPTRPKEPQVDRSGVYVEVYNNSTVSGLAGRVAARASDAGWQVVGADNWYGTITATTVYYPRRLKGEARLLALDLGIERTAPAVDPMRLDRLTVILTGPLR